MQYIVVLEKGKNSYGAFVPDVPGCIVAGETKEEALELIAEAIEFHLEGMKQEGLSIPIPNCSSEVVNVNFA